MNKKEQKRLYDIEYRKKNKKKISRQQKNKYIKNKKQILENYRKIMKTNPEKFIFHDIKNRCNNKNSEDYKNYGGRGIECHITEEEIRFLMERDDYWNIENQLLIEKIMMDIIF